MWKTTLLLLSLVACTPEFMAPRAGEPPPGFDPSEPVALPPLPPPGGLGSPCTGGSDCREGLCDLESAACALAPGARCDGTAADHCAHGTRCVPTSAHGPTTCAAPSRGFCDEDADCTVDLPACRRAEGAPADARGWCSPADAHAARFCASHDACPGGAVCRPDVLHGGAACQAPGAPGDACIDTLGSRACAPGLACSGGRCGQVEGAMCAAGTCGAGLRCVAGVCARSLATIGGRCLDNADCQADALCSGGLCIDTSALSCVVSGDCPAGAVCVQSQCRRPHTIAGSSCDPKAILPCPAPLRCAEVSPGQHQCLLANGVDCIDDASCASGACIVGVCGPPRGLDEPCGRYVGTPAPGTTPERAPVDAHCAGNNICHGVYMTCQAPRSGAVWARASRDLECAPELVHSPEAGECVIDGPALWDVRTRRLVAQANDDSYGAWACVDLDELAAEAVPFGPELRTQEIVHAWSLESFGEDVPHTQIVHGDAPPPGLAAGAVPPRNICIRIAGRTNGFLGIGRGRQNRLTVLVSLVVYNPSKVGFFPKDLDYPAAPRPFADQLFHSRASDNYRAVLVPPDFEGIGIQLPWTYSPSDPDSYFVLDEASFTALDDTTISIAGAERQRGVMFQSNLALNGVGPCPEGGRLTTQQLIFGWRKGQVPAASRVRSVGHTGQTQATSGYVVVPKYLGYAEAPALVVASLKGVIGRMDLYDGGGLLFRSCSGILNTAPASGQAQALCPPPEDGHARVPFQNEIVGGLERGAEAGCESLTNGTPIISDFCGPIGQGIGQLASWIFEAIIDAFDGCGGEAADADCQAVIDATIMDREIGFFLQTGWGNNNCRGAADFLSLQLEGDDRFHRARVSGRRPPGREGNACRVDADCAAGFACAAHPNSPRVNVCLPQDGQACTAFCGSRDRVCRTAAGATADACLLPAALSEPCGMDVDCAAGLACFAGSFGCYAPVGVVGVCGAAQSTCPPQTACVGTACVALNNGPCEDDTWCASGRCNRSAPFCATLPDGTAHCDDRVGRCQPW